MIFSILFTAITALPVKRDTTLPDTCQVLSTLFVQCSNGGASAPSIYPPHCDIDGQGFVTCCAVTPSGSVTDYCEYTGPYSSTGCQVLDTTLQLECRNSNGGLSLMSPVCSGSSDGSSKCCALNQDGSASSQCVSSPAASANTCTVLSDLTLQCVSSSGVTRKAPNCTDINGVHKCCAYSQDGSISTKCQAIA